MRKSILSILLVIFAAGAVWAAKTMSTSQSVEIDASPEKVWTILVDVDRWAEDNPAVQSSKLLDGDGETVGSVVKLVPIVGKRKVRIKLTLTISEKHKKLEYAGKIPGVDTIMGFTLEEKNGGTVLTNYEKASGAMLKLISQQDMDEEHRIWVEAVKKRAEAR